MGVPKDLSSSVPVAPFRQTKADGHPLRQGAEALSRSVTHMPDTSQRISATAAALRSATEVEGRMQPGWNPEQSALEGSHHSMSTVGHVSMSQMSGLGASRGAAVDDTSAPLRPVSLLAGTLVAPCLACCLGASVGSGTPMCTPQLRSLSTFANHMFSGFRHSRQPSGLC